MRTQLAVLGGGPGGYAAAFLAADLGMEVTLVEAEPRLGGVCLLRGCIPSKTLLHVARVLAETRELGEWGFDFGKPTFDLDTLRARKEKVVNHGAAGLKQLAKQRKVRVVNARGAFASSQILRLEGGDPATREGDQLEFEHAIVATGSSPAIPAAFRLEGGRVMDSTGALELQDVPGSLLVVGGGYIGLEMGTVYANLGTKVTVVELTSGLLPGADRDLVRPLQAQCEKLYAAIHLETKVAGLANKGKQVEATLEAAGGSRTEKFDRVLVAIGRRPNSQGLGLENTKAVVDERGFLVVDDQQRTADPRILAIGDVAGEPMLAHKATYEGRIAVEALHGGPAANDARAIPAVVFTDPELAWAGLTEEQAKAEGREVEVARFPWGASGRAQSLGRTEGLTKILVEPDSERVLGIGVVGAGAGELISEGVVLLEMGATARDLAESIHPHPTLSETLRGAAEVYLGTATDLYRPKRS